MMQSARERSWTSWLGVLVLCVGALVVVGCSDEVDEGEPGDDAVTCELGERYNPILGRCELEDVRPGVNNITPNPNNQTTPGGTNNGNTTPNQNNTSMNPDMGGTTPDMGGPDPTVCGYGEVRGVACAPSGDVLGAATVTIEGVDCHNGGAPVMRTTQTGGDGFYSFEDLPSGVYTVRITSGSFSRELTVDVFDGQTVDLTRRTSKECIGRADVSIAVVSGLYDDVEGILRDLGLDFDIKGNDGGNGSTNNRFQEALNFLQDLDEMNQYDIIFINCGELYNRILESQPLAREPIMNNLMAYIAAGGSLYGSDWSSMFVEGAAPEAVDFLGDDTSVRDARDGYAPQLLMASVNSQALQTVLGTATVEIDFPHDPQNNLFNNNWAMVEGANMNAVVHLSGTVSRCADPIPLIDMMPCTRIDGSLQNAPLLVSYKDPMSGGAVVFTSFHNHTSPSAPISEEIKQILKFLIFQL